ncbi:hypothetical protein OO015_03340 [Thermomicrobium sp. 4228-Ro]|uniref:hypothetical protein n=1 Tax=Thermomicrobium sp. 4228-Ro TaxID=2993937 RepID=UPI0022495CDA|nr:hypothetical protein [Thermomicrobium sp. 4228-Ro]MCX2726526.1 hypothetical protein [Thermomicrobium sp. 4228-Ro]
MRNPFDWDYLTAPLWQTPTWGPFSIAFVTVYVIGFLACLWIYNDPRRLIRKRDPLLAEFLQRIAGWGLAVFGVGLFFFLFRLGRISAFNLSMRIWLYLSALSFLVWLLYAGHVLYRVYRPLARQRQEELRRKQYARIPKRAARRLPRAEPPAAKQSR